MRHRISSFLVGSLLFISCGPDPEVCPFVSCPPGLECVDGECVDPGDPCDGVACGENASCEISLGAALCVCDIGFGGDGVSCVDVDECSEGVDDCDPDTEVCRNLPGGFVCDCRDGFALEGESCVDVDECALGLHSCPENTHCFNTHGSHECRCDPGYSGDDLVCHPSWSKLAAGFFHYCAIRGDGSLWCWGANSFEGQLGQGDVTARLTPTRVGAHSDWIDISSERETNCGIRAGGSLWCWGKNDYGQTGVPAADVWVPTQVGVDTDWSAVAAGQVFGCGIRAPGRLYCWGHGWGTTPVRIGLEEDWMEIAAGVSRACGRRAGGAVYCWMTGQSSVSRWGGEGDVFDEVSLGGDNVCAVREGELFCSGQNAGGQAGIGSTVNNVPEPTRVDDGGGPWASPGGMNGSSTCAIRADGSAWCWGTYNYGALGHGDFSGIERSPVPVGGGHMDWEALEPMAQAEGFMPDMLSCGLRDGGRLFCWGGNQFGMIDGAPPQSNTLVRVEGPELVSMSSSGNQTCGIDQSGALICWGLESVLSIGPFRVPGLYADPGWDSFVMGQNEYGCGLRGTELWCFGANDRGQLGQGHTESVAEIVRVGPDHEWKSVSVGRFHACGIRTDDLLLCWGDNSRGQIGGVDSISTIPEPISDPVAWQTVAAGDFHTCAIHDGSIYCWGNNDQGQLGRGSMGGNYSDPAVVRSGIPPWTRVSAGRGYTCALSQDESAWCWGSNAYGQMGVGHENAVPTPEHVWAVASWASITTGWLSNTCGVTTGGTLWTWGSNVSGQLGDGSDPAAVDQRSVPELVGQDADWESCAFGYGHLCALKGDGSVWCAGMNNGGQLGDGRAWHYDPTPVAGDL